MKAEHTCCQSRPLMINKREWELIAQTASNLNRLIKRAFCYFQVLLLLFTIPLLGNICCLLVTQSVLALNYNSHGSQATLSFPDFFQFQLQDGLNVMVWKQSRSPTCEFGLVICSLLKILDGFNWRQFKLVFSCSWETPVGLPRNGFQLSFENRTNPKVSVNRASLFRSTHGMLPHLFVQLFWSTFKNYYY